MLISGRFAGEPLTQAEEMNDLTDALYNGDTMTVDRDGVVHLDGGSSTTENGAEIPKGTFAAPMPSMPNDSTQWYNKNGHRLFRSEVAAMKKFFPKAGFGFMKSTGDMYWVIDLKISQTDLLRHGASCWFMTKIILTTTHMVVLSRYALLDLTKQI